MSKDDVKKDEPIDLETMSDEDFLKLDEPPEVVETTEETPNEGDDAEAAAKLAADAASADVSGGVDRGSDNEGGGEGAGEGGGDEGGDKGEAGDTSGGDEEGALSDEEIAARDAMSPEEKAAAETKAAEEAEAAKTKSVNDDKETLKLKEDAKAKEGEETPEVKSAREAQELAAAQESATAFFDKVSAPFKADGKDVQVRTAEEAIKLMQMGVNYSRRMKEMKPLRETHAMLETHGLNDPQKLNELIDLSKGGVPALQKHLKKHSIDPLDLDPTKGEAHTTPNYRADPKDVAFQDAIDNTLQAEGGKELLVDVNKSWDEESKEALRENPSIFGKLLEQKETGLYKLINTELHHQRTMGYLADVPFLQAYEQVGNAMQKAGVFDKKEESQKKTGMAPIASGSRKAPAKKEPNPNLSSSKSTAKAADAAPPEPDYLTMSDDDFMKLAIPGG